MELIENKDVILKEYEMLRAEILDRSKRENDSLLWSLTLVVALFGTNSFRREVISIIPLAFSFFGYIWIENSMTIYIIGKYIKTKIEDKIFKSEELKESLGWENFIQTKHYDFKRKGNTFFVIPILYFGLISIAAIVYQIFYLTKEFEKLLFFSAFLNTIIYFVYITYWNRSRKYKNSFE